jgi:hypothetical protein
LLVDLYKTVFWRFKKKRFFLFFTTNKRKYAGGMFEDHDRCFSILVLGAFSTGVFNTNALPRINIGADVWGESSIMTGVC